jgi:hypothetical protein
MKKKLMELNLQLFDGEGGAIGATATGEGASQAISEGEGNTTTPDAEGNQDSTNEQVEVDPATKFEELIKGDYKEHFASRVQTIIDERFKESKKSQKALESKIEKLSPMLTMLSSRYGVDANDTDKLFDALQNDNTLYEDEALSKGLSVEQLKQQKKLELENSQLKAMNQKQIAAREQQEQDKQSREHFAEIQRQANEAKKLYPNLDLKTELNNPDFVKLLHSGVPVDMAYRVAHDAEITTSLMAQTAQQAQQQTINNIKARNQSRPQENGLSNNAAVDVGKNYNDMPKDEFMQKLERARKGESI